MGMWSGMWAGVTDGSGGTVTSPVKKTIGGIPIGGAKGLDMVVGPGYPNDSGLIRVSSGERVIVIPSWNPASRYSAPAGANTVSSSSVAYNNQSTYNNSYNLGLSTSQRSSGVIRDFDTMRLRG